MTGRGHYIISIDGLPLLYTIIIIPQQTALYAGPPVNLTAVCDNPIIRSFNSIDID